MKLSLKVWERSVPSRELPISYSIGRMVVQVCVLEAAQTHPGPGI